MQEVAERLGYGPIRNRKIRSPWNPEDNTPSCHLYDYDWYDYSTGRGGDQISFVAEATGRTFVEAVRWLAGGADIMAPQRKWEPRAKPLPDLTEKFWQMVPTVFPPRAYQWADFFAEKWPSLGANGFSFVWDCFGVRVGANGDLLVPHVDPDDSEVIRGIKIRTLDGAKRSVPGSTYTTGLYSDDPGHHDVAVLVEGESDVWCATDHLEGKWDSPPDVYGLPAGAAMWRPVFAQQLRRHKHVYLGLDDDEPGRKATERIVDHIGGSVPVTVLDIPGGRMAEALADGWNLAGVLDGELHSV